MHADGEEAAQKTQREAWWEQAKALWGQLQPKVEAKPAAQEAVQEPGMTLAAAVRRARQEAQKAHPGDPTYLAYSLYAHPNARLVLKGLASAAPRPTTRSP